VCRRLGSITRPTADADTVARSQAEGDAERRAFALARHFGLTTAEPERIIVATNDRNVILDEVGPVATLAAWNDNRDQPPKL